MFLVSDCFYTSTIMSIEFETDTCEPYNITVAQFYWITCNSNHVLAASTLLPFYSIQMK